MRLLLLLALAATLLAAETPPDLKDGLPVAAPGQLELGGLTAAFQQLPGATSLLVLHRGRLVYEAYANEGGRDLLNDTRSTTKTVTAMAVGAAVGDGHLASARVPLFALLGDLRPFAHDGPLKQAITLEDCLTMSSALACNDEEEASPGNEENMYPLHQWTRWAVDLPVRPDYVRDREGRGPWSYCTAGTLLLGQALQRATGASPDRYIETRLLAPLGITHSQWKRSPSGEVLTGGGLRLRSRDLAKLGLLLLDGGRYQGRQLLPAAWVKAMLTVQRKAYSDFDYGYLIWRHEFPGGVPGWLMAGTGGSAVLLLQDQATVVVLTRSHFQPIALKQTLGFLTTSVVPRF